MSEAERYGKASREHNMSVSEDNLAARRKRHMLTELMSMTDEGLNSNNTMHGGLIGMVAEEATLSLAPAGSTLSSLGIRYLSPVRTGPAVGTAAGADGLYRVQLRDAGSASRLAALATARTF